jgi:hypothetical protein
MYVAVGTDPSIPLWVIILSSIASALLAALVVGALLFFIMRKRCKGTTINIELIGKILFFPFCATYISISKYTYIIGF